jgi:hypothetical protein
VDLAGLFVVTNLEWLASYDSRPLAATVRPTVFAGSAREVEAFLNLRTVLVVLEAPGVVR